MFLGYILEMAKKCVKFYIYLYSTLKIQFFLVFYSGTYHIFSLQSDLASKQTFLKLKTDLESGTLNADELKELTKANEKEETHTAIIEENRKYTETCKAK